MKKYSILLAVVSLVLASLACQSLTGSGVATPSGGGNNPPLPTDLSVTPSSNGGVTTGSESEFPKPDDATNVMNVAGTLNFQTKLSLADAMKFYRDEFNKLGYVERSILTVTSDSTFSMVFDGHASGKAIVVQGVDLGGGSSNISIRLDDVPK